LHAEAPALATSHLGRPGLRQATWAALARLARLARPGPPLPPPPGGRCGNWVWAAGPISAILAYWLPACPRLPLRVCGTGRDAVDRW